MRLYYLKIAFTAITYMSYYSELSFNMTIDTLQYFAIPQFRVVRPSYVIIRASLHGTNPFFLFFCFLFTCLFPFTFLTVYGKNIVLREQYYHSK